MHEHAVVGHEPAKEVACRDARAACKQIGKTRDLAVVFVRECSGFEPRIGRHMLQKRVHGLEADSIGALVVLELRSRTHGSNECLVFHRLANLVVRDLKRVQEHGL